MHNQEMQYLFMYLLVASDVCETGTIKNNRSLDGQFVAIVGHVHSPRSNYIRLQLIL